MSQETQPKITTVIKCKTCSYKVERPFVEGDFVLKTEGRCPNDGGELYIDGIYSEEKNPEEKKNKKQ
ncbi:hypothetical protein HS7_21240 [Sulfolobales archaeon HS-7]|nr:hypothetical protein HS7_21240 [Sulfolobales archaeon HS-7]